MGSGHPCRICLGADWRHRQGQVELACSSHAGPQHGCIAILHATLGRLQKLTRLAFALLQHSTDKALHK